MRSLEILEAEIPSPGQILSNSPGGDGYSGGGCGDGGGCGNGGGILTPKILLA